MQQVKLESRRSAANYIQEIRRTGKRADRTALAGWRADRAKWEIASQHLIDELAGA